MKRLRKIKYIYFIILIFIITLLFFLKGIVPTLSRYYNQISVSAVGYGINNYTISYELNGGIQAEGQVTSFNSRNLPITLLEPTKSENTFLGWYTDSSFSGDAISVITVANNYTLYAKWIEMIAIAEVEGTYYTSVQAAVDAVPDNNEKTTIKLLANTSENIIIPEDKNIVLNLQNHTISNNGNNRVIDNKGTVEITNGTITSSSTNCGAIDNYQTGKVIINGGEIIINRNGRQAIYNNKGYVEIKGDSYLSSESSTRATVTNLESGTLNITGGTVISTRLRAIDNSGNMTIGIKDGNISREFPMIKGKTIGINSTSYFNYYDGIIKGVTAAISDETLIDDKEIEYDVVHKDEKIGSTIYKDVYLAIAKIVTFEAGDSNLDETTRAVEVGYKIGKLPQPTKENFAFTGWYTLSEGGEKITENTIITDDITYYAHWIDDFPVQIGQYGFYTLQNAIDYVKANNVQVNITLLKDINEAVTISANKNIVFDMQNYKMRNKGNYAVIKNFGTLEILNANVESDAENGAVDNEMTGIIKINSGKIIATGTRQAIYNNGGIIQISGNSYLRSSAIGKYEGTNLERATIQNLENGIITITEGTIICETQQAISNEGTVILGVKEDGNVDNSMPIIQGETYGIVSLGTFNYYDGIIKGITDTISGSITEKEPNTEEVDDAEIINDKTYKIKYLEPNGE